MLLPNLASLPSLCIKPDPFITFFIWIALGQRDFRALFRLREFNETRHFLRIISFLLRDENFLGLISAWYATELPRIIQRLLEICCTL